MGRVIFGASVGVLGLIIVFAGCGGNVVVDASSATSATTGASSASSSTGSGAGGSTTCVGSDPMCCSTSADCGGLGLCETCPDGTMICSAYACVAGQCANVTPPCPASSSSASSSTGSSSSGSCLARPPDVHRASDTPCAPSKMVCMTGADCIVPDGQGGVLQGTCTAASVCDYNMCALDADCAPDEICQCNLGGGPASACIVSACRTDADCGAPGYCSPNVGDGCGTGWECRTCMDTCVDDNDCTQSGQTERCSYDPSVGFWSCRPVTCSI